MDTKSQFAEYLAEKFPGVVDLTQPKSANQYLYEHQFTDKVITLPKKLLSTIQAEVDQYWALRQWGENNLKEVFAEKNLRASKNFGLSMSYDFHVNSEGGLELIEVNTNSGFMVLGLFLNEFLRKTNGGQGQSAGSDYRALESSVFFSVDSLVNDFREEIQLSQVNPGAEVLVMDENPVEQRLYMEQLIVSEILKSKKINSKVVDVREAVVSAASAFIYNRHTDFYLETEVSKNIRNAFNEKKVELSPNPHEYFLLADKQRFIDWNQQTEVQKPKSLLEIWDLSTEDKEKIWSLRKNLFFKPKTSFAGKQVYKGASISQKVFSEVCGPGFIAQKISKAPTISFGGEEFKYDLRCYTYKNKLQIVLARIYQGQTTNMRTPGGGFACVQFV